MKRSLTILLGLALCSLALTTAYAKPSPLLLGKTTTMAYLQQQHLLGASTLQPGAGYSYDLRHIAPQQCFNTTVSYPTGATAADLDISTSKSFADLQKELHINVSASGGYGFFSASAEADYLHSVEDKAYSLSLNYYYLIYGTANIQPNDATPLNERGKQVYDNNHKYFGVICGDDYLDSYDEGAELLMSININFKSTLEKKKFTSHVDVSGSLFDVAASVEQKSKEYHLNGTVEVQAYQKGGDPTQLVDVMHPNAKGQYPIFTCDLQHMTDCVTVAGDLFDYARDEFKNQISYAGAGKGLVPLGLGLAHHTSIAGLGLQPSASLVPTGGEIDQDRQYLINELQKNQYYQQKFHQLLVGYPVPWDTTSAVYKTSQTLANQVNANIDILLSPNDPDSGALACYENLYDNVPNNCQAVTAHIKQQIKDIESSDLSYLKLIQYVYPFGNVSHNTPLGGLWSNGAVPDGKSTGFALYNTKWTPTRITFITVNTAMIYTNIVGTGDGATFKAYSKDGGKSYTGDYHDYNHDYGTETGYRQNNPFYITAYAPPANQH